MLKKNENKIKAILFLILIISIFFRIWRIKDSPPGLYPDEAMNGNDALDSLKNNDFKLFYQNNNGREGLFVWIIALFFYLFNVSLLTLKLPSIIAGILTILGLFLLTKEIFFEEEKKAIIALLASFLLSVSFWHVNFSRIAFRGILVPFFLVFSFYFLLKSFRTRKIKNSIISGLFFGLGFYTYSSFYFSVILLFLFLILSWRKNKDKIIYKLGLANLLTIFFTALPMGILLLTNPQQILNRSSQVSIFNTNNVVIEFFKSLFLHLGIFNFMGDRNWRHNIAGKPQLLWIVGIFFLFGLFLLIKKIIKKEIQLNEKVLLSWFFIMLLPGVLTSTDCPHALRIIGTIPAVYIISSIGAINLYKEFEKRYGKNLTKKTSIIILLLIFALQFNDYFLKWPFKQETEDAFSSYYVKIGRYLNAVPDSIDKIVIVNFSNTPKPWPKGLPVSAQTTMFIESTENKQSLYLLPEEIDQIKTSKKTIIIPIKKNDSLLLQKLQKMFPKGKIVEQNNILIFKI